MGKYIASDLPKTFFCFRLHFYTINITVRNLGHVALSVVTRMVECCEQITPEELDCTSMRLIGGHMGRLLPNTTRNASLLFPNMYTYNRQGECLVAIWYKDSYNLTDELKVSVPFNTYYVNGIVPPCMRSFENIEDLSKICPGPDLDPLDDCRPVNCHMKYNGNKNYFCAEFNICVPNPTCYADPRKALVDVAYLPTCNECRDLEVPITEDDVRFLTTKRTAPTQPGGYKTHKCHAWPSGLENTNIRCHHGKLNLRSGLCDCDPGWSSSPIPEDIYVPSVLLLHMCNIKNAPDSFLQWRPLLNDMDEVMESGGLLIILLALLIALIIVLFLLLAICLSRLLNKEEKDGSNRESRKSSRKSTRGTSQNKDEQRKRETKENQRNESPSRRRSKKDITIQAAAMILEVNRTLERSLMLEMSNRNREESVSPTFIRQAIHYSQEGRVASMVPRFSASNINLESSEGISHFSGPRKRRRHATTSLRSRSIRTNSSYTESENVKTFSQSTGRSTHSRLKTSDRTSQPHVTSMSVTQVRRRRLFRIPSLKVLRQTRLLLGRQPSRINSEEEKDKHEYSKSPSASVVSSKSKTSEDEANDRPTSRLGRRVCRSKKKSVKSLSTIKSKDSKEQKLIEEVVTETETKISESSTSKISIEKSVLTVEGETTIPTEVPGEEMDHPVVVQREAQEESQVSLPTTRSSIDNSLLLSVEPASSAVAERPTSNLTWESAQCFGYPQHNPSFSEMNLFRSEFEKELTVMSESEVEFIVERIHSSARLKPERKSSYQQTSSYQYRAGHRRSRRRYRSPPSEDNEAELLIYLSDSSEVSWTPLRRTVSRLNLHDGSPRSARRPGGGAAMSARSPVRRATVYSRIPVASARSPLPARVPSRIPCVETSSSADLHQLVSDSD